VFCNAKRTGGGYQENGWGNHADGQNSPPIAAPEIFQTQEYQERGKYSAKVVWLNPETGGLQEESGHRECQCRQTFRAGPAFE
jgi:hypothetical protein